MNETRRWRSSLAARGAAACLGAALAGSVLLTGGEAAATTGITLGVPTIINNGPAQPTRPNMDQYWISQSDCENNIAFQWTVTTTDGSFTWAASAQATTCPLPSGTTTTSVLQNCWQPSTGATDLPTNTMVTIYAKDLVEGTLGIKDCDPSTAPAGISWPQPITIFFYYPAVNPTDTGTNWTQTQISLVGPQPPSGVGLGFGDQELIASLPSTPTDPTTASYYFFCIPYGADGGASGTGGSTTTSSSSGTTTTTTTMGTGGMGTGGGDAGTAMDAGGGDAGTGGTGTGGTGTGGDAGTGGTATTATGQNDCPAGTTFPGLVLSHPDINSPYLCGAQVPATTPSYPIQTVQGAPLQNGIEYIVAIAAADALGSLGPVAPLQCGTPQPVDSFFPTYCAEGGTGCVNGCGSCNVGSGAPLWPALGAAALAGAAAIARRDRRRAARRDRRQERG